MKKQKEVEKQRNYVIRPLLKEKFTKSVTLNINLKFLNSLRKSMI